MRLREILKADLTKILFGKESKRRRYFGSLPPRVWRGPFIMSGQRRYAYLAQVTEQMASLVEQNLPLAEGIDRLADGMPRARVKTVLRLVSKDVAGGEMLHEAMARRSRFFPDYYVQLVRVGEENGRLAESLRELGGTLLHSMAFNARIKFYAS